MKDDSDPVLFLCFLFGVCVGVEGERKGEREGEKWVGQWGVRLRCTSAVSKIWAYEKRNIGLNLIT